VVFFSGKERGKYYSRAVNTHRQPMIATKGFGDTEMDFLPMTKISVKGNQKGLVSLAFAALLTTVSSAQAYDSYQLKVLFTPTKSDIEAEAKGRVMIYDGLKNETVEEALNAQFGRIDRMMFVRTQFIQENGEYETEEECD
jgi:hypothetical protein